jgi:hypothetical protein
MLKRETVFIAKEAGSGQIVPNRIGVLMKGREINQ